MIYEKKLFSLALIGMFGLVVTNFGTKVDAATVHMVMVFIVIIVSAGLTGEKLKKILQELLLAAGFLAWQVWDINILL